MKLSHFINDHIEEILVEWEAFARTLRPATNGTSALALDDHARQILAAIALDIETAENPTQQYEKSKGMAPARIGTESAASTHGTLRQISGFTLVQLAAEYRALRATVLRLWLPTVERVTQATTNDMIRFNETIDQALAESAVTYSNQATRTRDTFLAILGHDLRSPLTTITMAGDYLSRPEVGNERTTKVGSRIKRSAATMTTMVNDLLEYARTQLGGEMPITLSLANMKEICLSVINDASAAHPDCEFELETSGELAGYFDSERLHQVFANLLNNAAQYRAKEHPVTILADGETGAVVVRIGNRGPVIPPESLQTIFNPLVQLSMEGHQADRPSTSIGLGLFIAREIIEAHGGTIGAESSESSGTVFTVCLPRVEAAH
ncbi:HAMP domain-containing sensor histidine kinase [Undibacterium sp.]|uniref:HAMP domain-containing sensor histidine kinase n=1 Tax=Undibacterium sp. TaxID=1914977 RepID=UPI002C3D34F3|nr:HAMP domain-containing sensor histidine kinase [Undibacterium sp.]HTD04730.1 HAMP domain-containing sensor histidine kinase [Undibacterium sp.]